MLANFFYGHAAAGDHVGFHNFATLGIGHADHRRFQYIGVAGQHVFHLVGENLKSRDVDHIFFSINDSDVTVFLNNRHITGFEPALVVQDVLGFLRTIPVTHHHLRPRTQSSPGSSSTDGAPSSSITFHSVSGNGTPTVPG